MTRRQPAPYFGPTTFGIDVSRWQGGIDWDAVSQDTKEPAFAISRTGDGRSTDSQFMRNWKESKRVGLIRGSYHYFRADRDGKYQAEHVLKLLEGAGGFSEGDLPPALDIEDGASKNLSGGVLGGTKDLPIGLIVDECKEFLDTIEKELGVLPLVYTGQTFHWWLSQAEPELAKLFARYPLWTPDYRETPRLPANPAGEHFPWSEWTLWQYTSKGTVDGISTAVDGNFFRGDKEQLKQFIASLRSEAFVPDTEFEKQKIINEMRKISDRLVHLHEELEELD